MNQLTTTGPLDILGLIMASSLADATKLTYTRIVQQYLATGGSLTDVEALRRFAGGLPASRRGHFKSALRLWLHAVELELKAGAAPETVYQVQAAIWRLEAMSQSIKAPPRKGRKLHIWLNQRQVVALLESCSSSTLLGQRDRIVLGLLVGAGLRRRELVNLNFEDRALIPRRGAFRTVLQVRGKGAKDRVIPLREELAASLDNWRAQIGPGQVARAINQAGQLTRSISAVGVFRVVARAGAAIGRPELAPHDLRRTYAQLGYEAGVPITQISKLLGHASVATTQRYLNLELDLEATIGDFIPWVEDK